MRLHKILSSSLVLGSLFLVENSGFSMEEKNPEFSEELLKKFPREGFSKGWRGKTKRSLGGGEYFEIQIFPTVSEKKPRDYFPSRRGSPDCLVIWGTEKPLGLRLKPGNERAHWHSKVEPADFIMDENGYVAQWNPDPKKYKTLGARDTEIIWLVKLEDDRRLGEDQIKAIEQPYTRYKLSYVKNKEQPIENINDVMKRLDLSREKKSCSKVDCWLKPRAGSLRGLKYPK